MSTSAHRTTADLIADIRSILEERSGDRQIADFATRFYDHGSPEDLGVYAPQELAALAEDAFERLQTRPVGLHRITVTEPSALRSMGPKDGDISIIEIANDDMPFLLDSVLGELTEAGCEIRLVLHPILALVRQPDGRLERLANGAEAGKQAQRESLIHIHVSRIGEDAGRHLAAILDRTLIDVRRAVVDWKRMLKALDEAIDDLRERNKRDETDEQRETLEFLKWLRDDNFTFLGMRYYTVVPSGDDIGLERLPDTGLGVLVDPEMRILSRGADDLNSSSTVASFLTSPSLVTITKSNLMSRVHRRIPMDYIGLKLFSKKGKLTGELRMVGLFTSTAYTRPVRTIPHVRRKVDAVIERAGYDARSHSGKALINVLEHYPRDDMFQITTDKLLDFGTRILALDEHPRLRVLARKDQFDRFVSILVYVPRDRYNTDIRIRIGAYLETTFDGKVTSFQPGFPEGSLARVHFIISRSQGITPEVNDADLEDAVADLIRTWADRLNARLHALHPRPTAEALYARYERAFDGVYREAYGSDAAVADMAVIERLTASEAGPAINFYRQPDVPASGVSLKLYHPERPIHLSDRVPVLENMGLRVVDERTFLISPAGSRSVFLHDMTLERADGLAIELSKDLEERLEGLFLAVWSTRSENDGFNLLGLSAGLDWRRIALIRAYARYLRQVGVPYSQDYMWGTMGRYPAIAAQLVDLFVTRFDPDRISGDRDDAEAARLAVIDTALETVVSLDDDAILRRFVNAIAATLRTDWFRPADDGAPRDTVAFKLDSRRIINLPDPKPFREIWVYGARVEGIHTRFGKVARGGLRWSDRAQDFRTEVLGLVKAQQVKNAVIVPVGAKGGFFPKWLKPGMPRDAWFREGTAAYEIFIASLLSVTDNLDGEAVVPPPRVVRHEPDDPYLVVAADKGTATFSDNANGISERTGFWLGDAFASGGSVGYDHKKMGITARGAFEAVKRHFREMDLNILATPFSVVGVGDMSGDVFGNGMLLAPTIKLVAAFDHRDIFIDPNPDLNAALAERQRLFDLPRSSWADYNKALISHGGGVFSRAAKTIELSPEAQGAIGLHQPSASPQEVMRAILKAKVDLLWFGGIGTYIRASTETNEAAGDRANDAIRISARDVGAKVIGEGANLGVTQRARIEFNLLGGRSNSDAIDNSAGVNCSDVEVNIKIAFGNAIRTGQIDRPARDRILAEMTDAVGTIVLRNNYLQTLAISVAESRGLEDFGHQRRLIQSLERAGRLDRAVEVLPDEGTLDERAKAAGLTRAEIGVLLAYAKLAIKDELLLSDVPDDGYLASTLIGYFPKRMEAEFEDAIVAHKLRREIVSTTLTNAIVDHGGPTLVTRVANQTGRSTPEIARAFVAALEIHGLKALFADIDGLDTRIPGKLQLDLYRRVQDLLIGSIIWLTRTVDLSAGIGDMTERFAAAVDTLQPELPALLPDALAEGPRQEIARLMAAGVPEDLAIRIGHLGIEAAIGDIVLIAETSGRSLPLAAEAYFSVSEQFRITRLEGLAHAIPVTDYYDGLALDRARGLLADAHRAIASLALGVAGGLKGWSAAKGGEVDRVMAQVAEVAGAERLTVSRFSVAAGLIADLARE